MTQDKPIFTGLDRNTTRWAEKRYEEYITGHNIESKSDKDLLIDLIKWEALQSANWEKYHDADSEITKLNKELKKLIESGEPSDKEDLEAYKKRQKEIDSKISSLEKDQISATKQIEVTQKNILEIKEKLGLFKEKEETSLTSILKDYYERIDDYINTGENGIVTNFRCPKCGEISVIIEDVLNKEVKPHPFFIDSNIIFNKHLFDCMDAKKITKEDVAIILKTTPQYIEQLYQEIYIREKHKSITITHEEEMKNE